MALYNYQAFSKDGKRVSGSMDGASTKQVQDALVAQGLFPSKINLAVQSPGFSFKNLFERAVDEKEKIFFTEQLYVLLKSGVPLVDALTLLGDQSKGALQSIIITLRDGIKEGRSLADGLELYPKTFETIYVQLVRAGEASGKLEVVLLRLKDYLQRRNELKKKVKGALTYPLIQLIVIIGVVAALLIFVVPQIKGMFEQQGSNLPLPTQILIGISDFLTNYYLILLGGIIIFYLVYRFWKATPRGAHAVDTIKLKIPIIKDFARTGAVVQFSNTLGLLLNNGVRLSDALDIVCKIVDNRVLVDELMLARENIIKQGRVAEYLKRTGIFPPVAIYLINTGEQSGQLDTMLMTVANNYEADLRDWSDALSARLSPMMLIFMAGIVGFIVLSIMLPLLTMGEILETTSKAQKL